MVNPFEHYIQKFSITNYEINCLKYQREIHELSYTKKLEFLGRLKRQAENEIKKRNDLSINVALQPELSLLLLARKKKQQQKLLKEIQFTIETLYSLPLHAWQTHKMPYSLLVADHMPKELNNKITPKYFQKNDDGSFEYEGYTNMTNKDMDIAVTKRNRVISEFLGNEETWFCFFRTMSGISGNEHPHVGSPHIHFISSAWGLSRDAVVNQLSSYRYNLNAETITFIPKITTQK